MAIDLLDAPLRVSWDLCSATSSLDSPQLRAVARQLLDAGLFYVSLEASPLQHPGIVELLAQLTAGGCQVSLVLTGEAEELALLSAIPAAVKLYLDCSAGLTGGRFEAAPLQRVLRRIRAAGREPFLLWTPQPGQLPLLLDLLGFCAGETIQGFKLPNQKIGASSGSQQPISLPDCSDLQQLATALRGTDLPDIPGLQLEVHDLFLWELLQPLSGGNRSEYGGCQAANSLGHVDATGQLWPCSSWPRPLGSLLEESLPDLWQSAARLQVRQQVAETPLGCEGCRDYLICFGGCRGLSSFCRDDGLKRDLLCAAKR